MERQVRLVAGIGVLVTVLASTAFEPFKWVAELIGAGLPFAAPSNTCAMGELLSKLPYNRGPPVNLGDVTAPLTGTPQ